MSARRDLNKLRKRVNAYLLAQNTHGFKDGGEYHHADCRRARERLCQAVYRLNAARSEPSQ